MTYDREAFLKEVVARNKALTPEAREARRAELRAKLDDGTATEQDKDELVSMPMDHMMNRKSRSLRQQGTAKLLVFPTHHTT